MEAIVSIFQTTGGQLAIDALTLGCLVWILTEGKQSRKRIYDQIDALRTIVHNVEVKNADMFGKIKGKLDLDD